MKKYDRESNTRVWTGTPKIIVYGVLALVSLFVIYVTLFATWLDMLRYPSFVGVMLVIGYLVYPAKKGVQKPNHIPWYDILIMVLGAAVFFYIAFHATDITMRITNYKYMTTLEVIGGIVAVLALVELCRRSVGVPILIVAGAFTLYALYYFTFTRGQGFGVAIQQLSYRLIYTTTGVMTTPIQVCAKFIVVFIIFGSFLERTGISEFFISLANCAVGRYSGGPAKVAVISSALCGMVSGSSVGNTVTTGSVTIPMMKKTGYKPEFAGAVEAAASTGGQIMPPIMGAAAFLMAEYVGVPYSSIIVRAILPAVLYFTGIFMCVHLEAKKLGLKGIAPELLPKFKDLVKRSYLLLPLIILVYLVASGSRTMAFSAAISIVFAVAVSNIQNSPTWGSVGSLLLLCYLFLPLPKVVGLVALLLGIVLCAVAMFKKGAHMTPGVFFDALANGAKGSVSVAAACAMAGIIAGCITMTGLASQIITAIIAISGGRLFVALFFTMLCCIVLGMGVPTTANYCIMASTCAPILIQIGVPAIAAHFFVFYFGIVADITPPVALAAYAGSAIAKSNPMKTGVNATKLAIAAFIVPYIFAYNPTMLFENLTGWYQVLQIALSAVLGLFGVATALNGHLFRKIPVVLRLALVAGGLGMMVPGAWTDVIGLAVVAAVVVFQFISNKKHTGVAA
ncbi:MAG: TRAP transporter permease [Eubacteriales bacterium]|nr:TRAP transporter permease [Eubacteriales bacterium]